MEPEKPRWMYRYDNYQRAFLLLREGVEASGNRDLTQLEKEGVIQRFEYTWELAWKVLKDYLEHKGVILETITPSSVIKAAFAAKVIRDGDIWMKALDARNKMSHTYNLKTFEKVIEDIRSQFLAVLDELNFTMLQEITKENGDA